jgi:hypothetical protein
LSRVGVTQSLACCEATISEAVLKKLAVYQVHEVKYPEIAVIRTNTLVAHPRQPLDWCRVLSRQLLIAKFQNAATLGIASAQKDELCAATRTDFELLVRGVSPLTFGWCPTTTRCLRMTASKVKVAVH